MNVETKIKLLRIVLVLGGLTSLCLIPISKIWPSGFVWHGGEGEYYFQMIAGIYAVLGAFMIYAARNPSDPAHRSFLLFLVIVNIVHSIIMFFQAINDEMERGHLIGDVPILFFASILIWYLLPSKKQSNQT